MLQRNNACSRDYACNDNTDSPGPGVIGKNACNGVNACTNNSGTIGNNACNGYEACDNNSGTIGQQACNADNACPGNTSDYITRWNWDD